MISPRGLSSLFRPANASGALLLALTTGCVTQPVEQVVDPRIPQLQQRLQSLEQRIDALERRNVGEAADRRYSTRTEHQLTREEMVSELQSLYLERERLLRRYMPKHPDVRRLDEEIGYLRDQLRSTAEDPGP